MTHTISITLFSKTDNHPSLGIDKNASIARIVRMDEMAYMYHTYRIHHSLSHWNSLANSHTQSCQPQE